MVLILLTVTDFKLTVTELFIKYKAEEADKDVIEGAEVGSGP